ncbi:MAG TPA: HTTM domain-containing protein, partial [Kofleriaceae bacterium]|nr:HTTM domain-containing protein [Kofleriaceae bacterium]
MTWLDRYWLAPAPAARLGVARALIGAFAAAYVIGRLPHTMSYAGFAPSQFVPIGVVRWVLDSPLPPWLVHWFALATALTAVPFMLGWRYRITGPLFAVLLLWTLSYNNSWGMIFHTENLLVLHVIILAAAPAADAWSLDARARPAPPALHGRYGWPLRLMAWVVVIAYVLAGIAKVRNAGMGWVWGDDLRNYIAMDNMRKLLLGDSYSPIA